MCSKSLRTVGGAALSVWASLTIATQTASAPLSTTYSYDNLGRLISAVDSTSAQVAYRYDAAGNRTQSSGAQPGPPTTGNDSINVIYNTPYSFNFTPGGGPFTSINVVTQAAHGSAAIVGTTGTYTPVNGYLGSDSFAYSATGPGGTSSPGTIFVTVKLPPAPTTGNDSINVIYNTPYSFNFTPGGGPFTSINVVTQAAHGSAAIVGTTGTYTPVNGYLGSDSFTYSATGPGGTSSPGTIFVTVKPPSAPTTGGGSITVAYATPYSFNFTPGGGPFTSINVVTQAAHGSAAIVGTTGTYTPAVGYYGSDSFTYSATGPGGTSSPGTIYVTINPPSALAVNLDRTSWTGTYKTGSKTFDPPVNVGIGGNGGMQPYTYAWQFLSGDNGTNVAPGSTSSAQYWARGLSQYGTYTSVWRVMVTDAGGVVGYSPNINVTVNKDKEGTCPKC